MIQFSIRHKGAISVFLCLILLPVFLFSSLIIDGTRVYSSQNIMASAGDLTMNTALSDYNTIVKDVYGLLAMSETPEQLSENLKSYMTDMIEREAGFTVNKGSATESLINSIAGLFTNYDDVTYDNIVNIEIESLEAYNVNNACLGNVNVLENQIVEYMKYRGPVTILTNGVLSKVSQLNGLDKQMEAIEAETEYQEQLADTGSSLQNAYEFLKKYEEMCDGEPYVNQLGLYSDEAGEIHDSLVTMMEYLLVANSTQLQEMTYWVPDKENAKELIEEYIEEKGLTEWNAILDVLFGESTGDNGSADEDDNEDEDNNNNDNNSAISLKNYETYLTAYMVCLENKGIIDNNNTITGDLETLYAPFASNYNSSDVELKQALVYSCNIEENKNNLDLLYEYKVLYEKYEECYKEENAGKSPSTSSEDYKLYENAVKITNTFKEIDENTKKDWLNCLKAMAKECWIESCGKAEHLVYARSARLYLQGAKEWLEDAKSKVEDLVTKREAWSDAVDDMDDGEVKTTFSGRVSEEEDVTVEELEELIGIVQTNIEFYDAVVDRYKAMYAGSPEPESQYELFTEGYVNKSDVYNSENMLKYLNRGIETKNIEELISADSGTTGIIRLDMDELGTQSTEEEEDNCKGFIDWYMENIDPCDLSGTAELDDLRHLCEISYYNEGCLLISNFGEGSFTKDYEDFQEESQELYGDNTVDGLWAKMKEWFASDDAPSEADKEVKNASGGYENLFTKIANEIEKGFSSPELDDEQLGDHSSELEDLINSINTASSAEEKSNLNSDAIDIKEVKNDSKIKKFINTAKNATKQLSKAKDFLSKILKFAKETLKDQRDILYVTEYMLENFSCATTNMVDEEDKYTDKDVCETTMSGYAIDPYNNYLYHGELEYILWGDNDITKDISNTKGMIFAIRFVLNTVYAFSAADIQNTTNYTASIISCGLSFLEPLVNVILTLLVSAGESIIDVNSLMKGNDVVLYKSKTTWQFKVDKIAANAVEIFAETTADVVIDDVFSKIEGVADDAINDLTGIAEEYINETEEKAKNTISDAIISPIINKLSGMQSSFSGKAEADVKELADDAVDSVLDKLSETLNEDTDGGCVLEAEKAAVEYLRNHKDIFVNKIVEYFNESTGQKAAEKIETLRKKLDKAAEDAIEKLGGTISDAISKAGEELKSAVSDACQAGSDTAKEKASEAITNYMGNLSGTDTSAGTSLNAGSSTSVSSGLTLNYKEYVAIFIMVEMEFNKGKMLQRMAALIQLNIAETYEGAEESTVASVIEKDETFEICKAYTMLGLNVTYHLNTLFLNSNTGSMPEFSQMGQTGGVTINYQSIMGY